MATQSTPSLKRWTRSALMPCLLGAMLAASIAPAKSASIDGVTFEPAVDLYGLPLPLSSCGLRETLWINLYAAALYLPQQTLPREIIMSENVPKKVTIKVTWDGSIPERVPQDWRDAFSGEVNRDLRGDLRQVYQAIEPGDVLEVAYMPQRGTIVVRNGETVLTRPDHALMAQLLEVWLGPQAVSPSLRQALLSGRCG